jgi:hypothetical protein
MGMGNNDSHTLLSHILERFVKRTLHVYDAMPSELQAHEMVSKEMIAVV